MIVWFSSQQEAAPKKEVMMKYGIYDETLGWITQQGRVVVSSDPGELRETIPFGEVRRVWLRRTVDLRAAFRKGESRVRIATTTPEGVDQIVGQSTDLPLCERCSEETFQEVVEIRTS